MKRRNLEIIQNQNKSPIRNKIYIATPTLGIVRTEWAMARFSQVIPCNWSASGNCFGFSHTFPQGYLVADAQNVAVDEALKDNFEWLLLLEDDVLIPVDTFLKLNVYMRKADIPVVSGLYYTKSNPSEPLVYRGRGNSCYTNWNRGEKVWADGVPTGCLLIHNSILRALADESPGYITGLNKRVKKVFETPAEVFTDPETGHFITRCGTSDLNFCDTVMNKGIFKKAGWNKFAKKKYPFLVDTSIFCKHIDLSTGRQYP